MEWWATFAVQILINTVPPPTRTKLHDFATTSLLPSSFVFCCSFTFGATPSLGLAPGAATPPAAQAFAFGSGQEPQSQQPLTPSVPLPRPPAASHAHAQKEQPPVFAFGRARQANKVAEQVR